MTNSKTYDILGLAVECGRRVPLASVLPVGGRKGVATTTSSYRGVETATLPVRGSFTLGVGAGLEVT
jgi:hypothetical protein